jgi:hypothetical protein
MKLRNIIKVATIVEKNHHSLLHGGPTCKHLLKKDLQKCHKPRGIAHARMSSGIECSNMLLVFLNVTDKFANTQRYCCNTSPSE